MMTSNLIVCQRPSRLMKSMVGLGGVMGWYVVFKPHQSLGITVGLRYDTLVLGAHAVACKTHIGLFLCLGPISVYVFFGQQIVSQI